MSKRISIARETVFGALCAASVVPIWRVEHPPFQDLPQHLAAIRVLADFGDPSLRFEETFERSLGSTQYLAYYLAAWALSKVVGVILANKLLVTASLVGIPYALRSLLRSLGRDERLALFWLPLTYNAHLILGFFNFVAAIPLALWGLSLAVRLHERAHDRPARRDAIVLAVVAVVCFYTHVVPFGFLGLGAFLVGVGTDLRATARRLWPLVPAALAAVGWTQTSPAGKATLTAAFHTSEGGPAPQHQTWADSLSGVAGWLTDVLYSEVDEQLLVVWGLLVLTTVVLGATASDADRSMAQRHRDGLAHRLAILSPLAGLAYFMSPASYDWIWPINARFPLLCLVFLIPVLPAPRKLAGWVLVGGMIAVSVLSFLEVGRAFDAFEEEVGDLDGAIESIPVGSRVAGLIFDRGSREVKFSPFIHSVAYYQAERGGAVMFTFADFPHSPFVFREGARPPRVVPRWEWMPERVDPARDLDWYDYVLVRGGPGRIARMPQLWEPVHRSLHWSVWHRLR